MVFDEKKIILLNVSSPKKIVLLDVILIYFAKLS